MNGSRVPAVLPAALSALIGSVGLAALIAIGAAGADSVGPPSPSIGNVMNRNISARIADIPLTDQQGRVVTLDQLKGKAVLLAPFLTSCQEECPITTGALLRVQSIIAKEGLAGKVVVIEVTVDPGRDTPQRMAAYARLTGSTWPLLTGTTANLAALWHYFAMYVRRVPEGSPPGIDWESGLPYTYDVDHSDGFVLLAPDLRERFVAGGMAQIATVPKSLHELLDAEGDENLKDPGGGAWTVSDALGAIHWVLQQSP